ncbi:hypothetical protein [Sinorhizobium medicae]|uniref:hypothetical protein n=1 Tax=Sinorhizobium medicae TaxID=110321 RepID=UPI001F2284DC|nr:hypothetical protein [Sinorhizobium medicae]
MDRRSSASGISSKARLLLALAARGAFRSFAAAPRGTRKPSSPRMLDTTFMRLSKCISFFDGEPTLLSSMERVSA